MSPATAGTKGAEVRPASVKERIQRSIAARRSEDAALQGQAAGLAVGRKKLSDYPE
jgi:hypothetical protein